MTRTAGTVQLVGAGPGDPELVTVKAVRALATADVILVDDLVDPAILGYARREARVIRVGKRGGCRSTPQSFIERLMIRYARRGRRVVRLKGGDPLLFGRGGEEAATLAAAGIDVAIIPGITAGIAAPASIGIPVTHRDCTHGVTFVTGHAREGSRIDWRALAQAGTTIVIYMGMTHLAALAQALVDAGLSPAMPAAAIERATTARERHVIATLGTLACAVRRAALASPAILVIGDVVAARTALAHGARSAAAA
jgi:uroporphyrin-III C-methyltransferase